ncbi:PREDICTED: uncharacterized protein LOC104807967 [Tarenaya hassleriana]|uniref:uncharacterized protein LOC104807967 n=1 Tax=Tarenaya hassleriana TaxID=28532 RepID=UPI00053C6542|nr:PREDICTED: uncharacterized protein LOC104807967 [Tarenaya hassleriana]
MVTEFPKSQIVGVQSVMPAKVTQHRKVRTISVGDPAGAGIFRRTLDIVLYYKHSAGDEDSGWVLSGRLRHRRTAEDDGGGLEVVANDSGVRLVEAKFPANLPEFLELVMGDNAKAEAEALFWRDIDEDDPQFSPLFYVQVTNFECGGYSVGISCSVLVADILIETDFLRKWSDIQASLLRHGPTKTPIFYLPTLKQDIGYLSGLSSSASVLHRSEPVILLAKSSASDVRISEKTALSRLKKTAGSDLDGGTGLDVFLFVKEQGKNCDEKLEVTISRHGEINVKNSVCVCHCDLGLETQALRLGFSELSFWGGKKPDRSSCKIGAVSGGLVLVVPFPCRDDESIAEAIVTGGVVTNLDSTH